MRIVQEARRVMQQDKDRGIILILLQSGLKPINLLLT